MKIDNQPPVAPKVLPRRLYSIHTDRVRILTDAEHRSFLLDNSDIQDSIDLWDRSSSLPGLQTASVVQQVSQFARSLAEVYFDPETGRFRYVLSGRAVPYNRLRTGVLRMSKVAELEMRELTARLISGEINQDQWYRRMRKLMKDEYRSAWITSIGGQENYNRRQQALFGRAVAPQFRWLDQFLEDLQSGRQPFNGRAVQRASMYARATNPVYQNNLLQVAMQNGFNEARRLLGETEHHCRDSSSRHGCIELSREGWVGIDRIVPIGYASCYSNCLCTYQFR